MSEHTPTPWRVGKGSISEGMGVLGPDGLVVGRCTLGHLGDFDADTDFADANAAFIVRACNAYDELLTVCKWFLQANDDGQVKKGPAADRGLAAAYGCLAKARGGGVSP